MYNSNLFNFPFKVLLILIRYVSMFCNDIPWTMHHLFIPLDQLIFCFQLSLHSGIVLARIQSSSANYFFSLMQKMLVILQSLWRHADHFCNLFKMVVILISILFKELSFTSCLTDFCYAINSSFYFFFHSGSILF
jgi:hypothetical protein